MYAALVAFAIVLPFVVLELVNRPGGEFPWVLFGVMWLLAVALVMLLRPWVATPRDIHRAGTVRLVSRLVGIVAIGWVWVALIADQWPCFMGVPNCD